MISRKLGPGREKIVHRPRGGSDTRILQTKLLKNRTVRPIVRPAGMKRRIFASWEGFSLSERPYVAKSVCQRQAFASPCEKIVTGTWDRESSDGLRSVHCLSKASLQRTAEIKHRCSCRLVPVKSWNGEQKSGAGIHS